MSIFYFEIYLILICDIFKIENDIDFAIEV